MVLIAFGVRSPVCRIRSWKNVVTAVLIPTCAIFICVLIILLSRKYDAFGIHDDRGKCVSRLRSSLNDKKLLAVLNETIEEGAKKLPEICRTYEKSLKLLSGVINDCPRLSVYASNEFLDGRTTRDLLQGMVDDICKNDLPKQQRWALEFARCYDKALWEYCKKNSPRRSKCE
ncbi:hypothetical protein RvY_00746 [Ramazzottius varieornatus]|uniref:Uncharacterized protein n=1 Tax=Ramazzottius varieornatus TaxID=947166 RepID=A0A1D1UDV7_RAMVA|nr:hypothetical protein RvY_00746 [Ramazzottius varieornatus]